MNTHKWTFISTHCRLLITKLNTEHLDSYVHPAVEFCLHGVLSAEVLRDGVEVILPLAHQLLFVVWFPQILLKLLPVGVCVCVCVCAHT